MTYIVVIGSINMDLVVKTDRMPKAGETLQGSAFKTIPGGKGANQAVAASRMGAVVKMVGAVGKDSFGVELTKSLSSSGVDVEQVVAREDVPTGTATIIVEETGENRIIIVPGANGEIGKKDIERVESLIRDAGMIVLQFEIPLMTIEYVLELAEKYSIPVILNPAPAYPVTDAFLKKIQYLIVNETEAEILSGIKVDDIASGYRAAEVLTTKGADTVCVTLGKDGAVVVNCEQKFHVPARTVTPVDTTAAGDTFVGALAAGCIQGKSLQDAAAFAVHAATLAVTRFGAQPSIPAYDEVVAYLSH